MDNTTNDIHNERPLTLTNGNGEVANFTSRIAWGGTDCDDASIAMRELQPVDSLLPAMFSDADERLFAIAAAAVFGTKIVKPRDNAEKSAFACVWNEMQALKGEGFRWVDTRVFSVELCVYADRFFWLEKMGHLFVVQLSALPCECAEPAPFDGFVRGGSVLDLKSVRASAIQAVAAAGGYLTCKLGNAITLVPRPERTGCDRVPCSRLHGDAALMIAMRSRTQWFKDYLARAPF